MPRLIKITGHSEEGKLFVDLIPRDTILKVAAEGDDIWVVDPRANGLGIFDDFISIPKEFAVVPNSFDILQRRLPF